MLIEQQDSNGTSQVLGAGRPMSSTSQESLGRHGLVAYNETLDSHVLHHQHKHIHVTDEE